MDDETTKLIEDLEGVRNSPLLTDGVRWLIDRAAASLSRLSKPICTCPCHYSAVMHVTACCGAGGKRPPPPEVVEALSRLSAALASEREQWIPASRRCPGQDNLVDVSEEVLAIDVNGVQAVAMFDWRDRSWITPGDLPVAWRPLPAPPAALAASGNQTNERPMTALDFLKRTSAYEGRIVSSHDLTDVQRAEARADGRWFVDDESSLGWAVVPWDETTDKDDRRFVGSLSAEQVRAELAARGIDTTDTRNRVIAALAARPPYTVKGFTKTHAIIECRCCGSQVASIPLDLWLNVSGEDYTFILKHGRVPDAWQAAALAASTTSSEGAKEHA